MTKKIIIFIVWFIIVGFMITMWIGLLCFSHFSPKKIGDMAVGLLIFAIATLVFLGRLIRAVLDLFNKNSKPTFFND